MRINLKTRATDENAHATFIAHSSTVTEMRIPVNEHLNIILQQLGCLFGLYFQLKKANSHQKFRNKNFT